MFAALTVAGCDVRNRVAVQNESGRDLDRVRLTVGGASFTLGPLADGESRSVSFVPDRDASLTLCVGRGAGETCADYGYVTPGLTQAHTFDILPDSVRYRSD